MSVFKLAKKIIGLSAFVVLLPICTVLINQPAYASSISVGDLHSLSNQERANAGLAPLSLNGQLSSAAYAKANHMFANNYWAHIAPDGTSPWTFINASGYVYISAGENLAMNFSTSNGVISGWMASSGHRANLLGSSYNDVGYAVVDGVLLSNQTTVVVAMYGSQNAPAPVVVVAPVTPVEQPAPVQTTAPVVQNTAPNVVPSISQTEQAPISQTPVVTETVIVEEQKPTEQQNSGVITVGGTVPEHGQAAQKAKLDAFNNRKAKKNGVVAGISSIVPTTINAYKSLDNWVKISITIVSIVVLMVATKFILFDLRDKNGNKYIWFNKRPVIGTSILALAFIISTINGIGITL